MRGVVSASRGDNGPSRGRDGFLRGRRGYEGLLAGATGLDPAHRQFGAVGAGRVSALPVDNRGMSAFAVSPGLCSRLHTARQRVLEVGDEALRLHNRRRQDRELLYTSRAEPLSRSVTLLSSCGGACQRGVPRQWWHVADRYRRLSRRATSNSLMQLCAAPILPSERLMLLRGGLLSPPGEARRRCVGTTMVLEKVRLPRGRPYRTRGGVGRVSVGTRALGSGVDMPFEFLVSLYGERVAESVGAVPAPVFSHQARGSG